NINVSIPKEGFVTLKVYNLLGQEVAVLINGTMKPVSNYKVAFDGSKLPTGVYVYKLTSPDGASLIKKMTLIK
ncbi:MAG: T9SS type A sorting domain-containing protein, partial [Ignavibacteriae bacterium]|nr:T9SS type A sorting domain-containing protein [Ignavibacteriota bacterium]